MDLKSRPAPVGANASISSLWKKCMLYCERTGQHSTGIKQASLKNHKHGINDTYRMSLTCDSFGIALAAPKHIFVTVAWLHPCDFWNTETVCETVKLYNFLPRQLTS